MSFEQDVTEYYKQVRDKNGRSMGITLTGEYFGMNDDEVVDHIKNELEAEDLRNE